MVVPQKQLTFLTRFSNSIENLSGNFTVFGKGHCYYICKVMLLCMVKIYIYK